MIPECPGKIHFPYLSAQCGTAAIPVKIIKPILPVFIRSAAAAFKQKVDLGFEGHTVADIPVMSPHKKMIEKGTTQ